jgi:hypothetical protein
MELVLRNLIMEIFIKVNILKESLKDKVSIYGLMEIIIKEILNKV